MEGVYGMTEWQNARDGRNNESGRRSGEVEINQDNKEQESRISARAGRSGPKAQRLSGSGV